MAEFCFNDSKELYGRVLGGKQQIDVYDVHSRKRDFTHISHEKISSFTFGSFVFLSDTPKRKSRRRTVKQAPSVNSISLIAIGFNNGEASIFDLHTQKVKFDMKSVHTSPITTLDICSRLNRVACGGTANDILSIWDENGICEKEIAIKDVNALKWSPEGKRIAVGKSKIHIIDPFSTETDSKGLILFTFKGHLRNCDGIIWGSSGQEIISYGKDDRAIYIWNIPTRNSRVKSAISASKVFMCSEFPLNISLNDNMQLLVYTQNATYYWDDIQIQTDGSTQIGFSKKIFSTKEDSVITGCTFEEQGSSDIILAVTTRNNTLQFKKISTKEEGKEVDISKDIVSSASGGQNKASVEVVGHVNVPLKIRKQDEDRERSHESFGEILQENRQRGIKEGRESLHTILKQALQSGDEKLMESIFRQQNPKVIYSTVSLLQPSEILPFLKNIADAYNRNPNSIEKLVVWITAVFHLYYSYIISNPASLEILSPIYRSLEERLSNYEKLSRLYGRIQLLNGQVKASELSITSSFNETVDKSAEIFYIDEDDEGFDDDYQDDEMQLD